MPIYEYQCQGCGHQFENLQKMSDPLLTECPACGEPMLKKMLTAAAVHSGKNSGPGCAGGDVSSAVPACMTGLPSGGCGGCGGN